MDLVTLKKKLSTYVSDGGRLRNVSEEVLYEVLLSWENWTGTATEFYRSIGFTQKQMAKLLGKAKKLKREGHFGSSDFKQVVLDPAFVETASSVGPCLGAEIVWTNGRTIRFAQVDMLMEFLKKSA